MEDVTIRVDTFEGKDAHRARMIQVERAVASPEVKERIMGPNRALGERPLGRLGGD